MTELKSTALSSPLDDTAPDDPMYKRLVETASDGIAIIQDRLVRYANPALTRLLGYEPSDVVDTSFTRYLPPAALKQIRAYYRALDSHRVPDIYETLILHKDGHTIPVELNTSVIVFRDQPADFVIFRSLEERLARQKLAQRLQKAQKLESLGVLAGGISHDFNNLLQGILGNADLALMYESDRSLVDLCLKDIRLAASKASELALKMLAYSGRGTFDVQEIDINRLIQETVEQRDLAIPRNAALRFNLDAQLPRIRGDRTQLAQVVANLLNNAVDAIGEESGTISIETTTCACDRALLSETVIDESLPEGDYVCLALSDTGAGIDENVLDKIFDPFFSTKFTGRGLGLAAVLGIVRAHCGAIGVRSSYGEGAVFKVYLPVTAPLPLPATTSSIPPLSRTAARGTILLVDDEATVRTTATRILERFGYSVIVSPDGSRAMNVFARAHHQIDIVLLDMMMPKMNGRETFAQMSAIAPGVKVILMSGYQASDVREMFGSVQPAGFLQKPFSARKLISQIRQVLDNA